MDKAIGAITTESEAVVVRKNILIFIVNLLQIHFFKAADIAVAVALALVLSVTTNRVVKVAEPIAEPDVAHSVATIPEDTSNAAEAVAVAPVEIRPEDAAPVAWKAKGRTGTHYRR